MDHSIICFDFPNFSNSNIQKTNLTPLPLLADIIDYQSYLVMFQKTIQAIKNGDSFLTNLTCKTPIKIPLSLEEIYSCTKAPYKILFKNKFICFSPEIFIKINQNGQISSYPMKGTIDQEKPNAKETLLNDPKELAEHYTIVDLIRNDLNKVASQVHVEKFRYIESIKTSHKNIFQSSSKVVGQLPINYHEYLGDILWELLPAGSISGAPKKSTLNIIHHAEQQKRGYYCGIAGFYDGYSLDSTVMIRFIEKKENAFFYRSGGGITIHSNEMEEYQEMINKIYLPF